MTCKVVGAWVFGAVVLLDLSAITKALAAPDQPRTVELVVVTAERRPENLQSAAVAATVLTADDLKRHDVHGVDDLEFSTPSLAIAHNGQSNQINIRGIGKEDNSGNATSAVAIYRDGIGTISGFATDEPYYDISTVEVLRGPQGTFSGENAAGGAIFINTRDPDPHGGYIGYVEAGYSNYNEFNAQGAINIPLLDSLAARVAFNHVNRDSFFTVWFDPAMTIRNPQHVGARDYNSVRVGVLWQPIDDLQVKFKFDYNNLDNHGYAFGIVNGWPSPGGGFFGGRSRPTSQATPSSSATTRPTTTRWIAARAVLSTFITRCPMAGHFGLSAVYSGYKPIFVTTTTAAPSLIVASTSMQRSRSSRKN